MLILMFQGTSMGPKSESFLSSARTINIILYLFQAFYSPTLNCLGSTWKPDVEICRYAGWLGQAGIAKAVRMFKPCSLNSNLS